MSGKSLPIHRYGVSGNGDVAAVAAGTSLVLWQTDGGRPPVKLRDAALQEAYSR